MAAELAALEESKEALERELASEPPPPVRLHPNLAEVYRDKVESLRDALNSDDIRADSATVLRGLIDEIRLIPVDGQLEVYLVGNLAAILDLCAKKSPGSLETGVQITLVAGARSLPFRTPVSAFVPIPG